MKKLGARPKLILPVLAKKSAQPSKPAKLASGEKRFRYEAAWTPHRENLRWQDMMFAGRGDLVGPDVFETSHKVVRGKHPWHLQWADEKRKGPCQSLPLPEMW